MSNYRGRVVYYGAKSFSHHDPGTMDTLGDRHWTRYTGKGPVQVYKDGKKFGPEFECLYTEIDGYRFTFSDYIGGQQLLLLGDFIFVHSSPYANYYHSREYTFLVATSDLVTADDMVRLDDDLVLTGMYKVDAGIAHKLIGEGDVVKEKDHISPFTRKVGTIGNHDDSYLENLLTSNPDLSVCGGAVRLKFNGEREHRWLFPHPDGVQAAVDHMKKTTLEDDWLSLMNMIDDAHPLERERVLATFGR